MARKKEKVIIKQDDKDLVFFVEQMPATRGFLFGAKVMRFLCKNNAKPSENESTLNLLINLLGGWDVEDGQSLMSEALECVIYMGASPIVCTPNALDSIVDDPAHVLTLLKKSLEVNLSFFISAIPENFKETMRGEIQALQSISKISKKVEK